MLRLRSTAAAMQRHILHPLPLLTDDVLVNGVYEPLQEERLVGGDIYDVVDSPFGTRVLIGDVQGKGLAAVGSAFAVIGAFREAAHREPTLTGLVDALDAAVVRHNSYALHTGDDERFVTALVVGVDAETEVQAVNCGHVLPHVLYEGTISTPELDPGVPLGLAELAHEPTTVGWFEFPEGATLLLSTDGLTETRSADGTFYPVDERLTQYVGLSPTELPQALHDDARAFALQRWPARRRRRPDGPPLPAPLRAAQVRQAPPHLAERWVRSEDMVLGIGHNRSSCAPLPESPGAWI